MGDARKLAAILAMDVVGYSRLMGEDESGTARAVRVRREAMRPIVREFGGRLVKTTGDGVLLEFSSVIAAVGSAIAMQKLMAERNAADPKPMLYRMGVNLGDVIVDSEDILGDGVNVAARLESICEPGGLALSAAVYDQVSGRVEAAFADLGEQTLKNIAKPVRVWGLSPDAIAAASDPRPPPTESAPPPPPTARRWPAIAAAVAVALIAAGIVWRAGWLTRLPGAPAVEDKLAAAPRLSIVVLPFTNLSSDPEQDYFADAVADDLTTDLSHLDGSFVIARNTAFTYKGKSVDIQKIGRDLGVRYVLEGSVRRADETISINAQLISTETGAHLWADRFDGTRADLGKLQVEVVARLANSLGVEIVKAESLRAQRERRNNLDAVDLALQGWATFRKAFTLENINAAIGLYDRALKIDPTIARAQIGLAMAMTQRLAGFRQGSPDDDVPRIESLLASALAADPDSAWAHYAMVSLRFLQRRPEEAISEGNAAIHYDRNLAVAHADSGVMRIFVGRAAEAMSEIETAMRLSPRDPFLNVWQHYECHAYAHLAQWEMAIEWCEKSAATNPSYWRVYVDLASAYAWLGRHADAKAAVQNLLKVRPGYTVQAWDNVKTSDNPTFKQEYERITEGLRKAGLPEGEAPAK